MILNTAVAIEKMFANSELCIFFCDRINKKNKPLKYIRLPK